VTGCAHRQPLPGIFDVQLAGHGRTLTIDLDGVNKFERARTSAVTGVNVE